MVGIIGNLLEHYDNALFGLLAPFIAPLFFAKEDPLTALILTYGMLPLGFVTRPLGSLFFAWIGDCWGRKKALFYSLLGMALVTIGMGCLPIYQEIGIWAPLLLALGRMLQSFFAAGGTIGGAIYVVENTPASKRGFISSFYDASSIAGILLASGLIAWMGAEGSIETNWRILFWCGGLTALFGIWVRLKKEGEWTVRPKTTQWLVGIKENGSALLSILFVSGFSYAIYSLAFTLMNGYIPLITSISKVEIMRVNTWLLLADMLLLPCFGYLAQRVGKERVMLAGAFFSILCAVPLFGLLDQATMATVVSVRLSIMIFGVAFAAPYYAWAIEKVNPAHRFLILSLGSSLGSQLIGNPTSAVCLWLYKTSGWCGAPGLYLMLVALGAGWGVYRLTKKAAIEEAK